MSSFEQMGFETRAVHVGQEPDAATGAVVPPIHLASTFAMDEVDMTRPYIYSRSGNPTRGALERVLASLEGATHGLAFASGMAASDAVLRELLPGDHLLIPDDAYGGTFRIVSRVYEPAGVLYTPVRMSDPDALRAAWTPATRMVWVESPTNPLLNVVDIAAVSALAHERDAIVVVDNTFATPYLQRPLQLGADVVVHSTTKYVGGHSDLVGGFVATSDAGLADSLRFRQNAVGAIPGPFDCYLALRGLKTLAVRMDRACANARAIAELLSEHAAVQRVMWPGLAADPGHEVARAQMRDFGAVVSFVHAGGAEAALRTVSRTRVFTLAESLGAVESLIEHPASMTHASAAGSPLAVDPAVVRLSVGIETLDDLLADLHGSLAD